jgi:SAM-dependent methyltransferase
MPDYQDHFSKAAELYASYRPTYPPELFDWLALHAPARECAWDCGTGSGQAAVSLAEKFDLVVATDPSTSQLSRARTHVRVHYAAMTAERSGLRDGSVHMVTVAQALHWFDRAQFFREADRVLVPRGLIAVWTYGLLRITPAIDEIMRRFYREEVGPFWPAERTLVDEGYSSLELPFDEIRVPEIEMSARWSLAELAGYVSSWSAVGRYRTALGQNPIDPLVERLVPLWGDSERRLITWPLSVRAGVSGKG